MKKKFIQLSFCGALLALSCCGLNNDKSQTESSDKDSLAVIKVRPDLDRFLARALDTTNHSFVPVVKTSDYLFWNGQKYLMSFSPLHFFKGYRDLYPDLPFTISTFIYATRGSEDKRYAAVWIIQNDSIYLADIDFHPLYLDTFPPQEKLPPPKEKLIGIMEDFLGAKFQADLRFDKPQPYDKQSVNGIIPARWVDGWLYIKRIQRIEQETLTEWRETVPFLLLKFQKGKLLSVEEVKIK